MQPESYDLVVIGGGPAGISGANTASIFGKRVALVEKLRGIGGAGINTGTIPSKTLRETALALSGIRSRLLHGVDLSLRRGATVDELLHHEREVTAVEAGQMRKRLDRYGVTVVHGTGSFFDPHTVQVVHPTPPGGVTRLRGEKVVIALGSR